MLWCLLGSNVLLGTAPYEKAPHTTYVASSWHTKNQ